MRKLVPLVAYLVACAGAPAPPAASSPAPAPAPSTSTTTDSSPSPGKKPIAPAAVPPAPAECAALVAHPATGCIPAGKARAMLAAALDQHEGADRDRALACLEESGDFAPGLLRALRAELAPEACADALATPLLEKPPAKLARELESAFLGLVVSGRLARLLGDPPKLGPPFSKPRFAAFLGDELKPWIIAQALAINALSAQGARLSGYGRGLAAIASGNADLRFVELVRAIPLPDEMRTDQELADAYYGSLDQALEPRKQRGRDAALVGMRAFAELGAVHDARVERARALISKLWSGSRVDALDRLFVPEAPAVDISTPERALAARLPTFYASQVLSDVDLAEPKLLRAFLERGLPAALVQKVDPAKLPASARVLLASGWVASGRQYFRAGDFQRARVVLGAGKLDDSGRLLAALVQALERGPEDAAELMLKGPGVKGSFDVSALDALAKQPGRYAGLAAFDAAYVLSLVPKPGDAAFWDDLAQRFDRAERLLGSEKLVTKDESSRPFVAHRYAEAAKATAATLRENK